MKNFKKYAKYGALLSVVVAGSAVATTASVDTSLNSMHELVVDWTQGTLGKLIALLFIVIGLVMGIGRGSLMAFAVGLGAAAGLFYSPTIIDSMFSAALPLEVAVN